MARRCHFCPTITVYLIRSWQAYTESDIAQIVIKAHVNWVIGSGLSLQAEPNKYVIDSEGFNFDKESFVKSAESRFRLYAKTKESAYNQSINYNALQRSAYLNAIISGDVLCVDMIVNGLPAKRLIDGLYVQNSNAD